MIEDRSDSEGQMASKKIKLVYEWCTPGPDEDRVSYPGSDFSCKGKYHKESYPIVEAPPHPQVAQEIEDSFKLKCTDD